MAEWARLLSECRGNLVAGSNPALPATRTRLNCQACFCLIWSHVDTKRDVFHYYTLIFTNLKDWREFAKLIDLIRISSEQPQETSLQSPLSV